MDQSIGAREQPRYIKLNDRDNVAIVVNDFGLPAGARFACGLMLRAFVPQGHKTALADIEECAPIVRYGEVIGYAASPILAGEWVDEARIRMPDAPSLDALEIATAVPPPLPPLEGFSFEGFRNADGSVGTKNILGISTSVQCVAGTMEYAVKKIRAELLPKYPNVDDVVALTHAYGCGVAIAAPDAVVPIRTLQNLALNPNFGGEILVVGLGCEKLAPERLVPEGVNDSIVRMARSSTRSWPRPTRGLPSSTGASARPAEPPISSSACNAAAATPFPASPPIPRSVSRPTSWCAPARP
jgi:galactarate dehydratase